MTDGATHQLIETDFFLPHLKCTQRHLDPNARVSPKSGARRPHPYDVRCGQGLPAQGQGRLKKLVQHLRLATLNIGKLTGRTRKLADALILPACKKQNGKALRRET